MATNNCRKCALSGVGACDDFPDCQSTGATRTFRYGDPVTVLNIDGDPVFVGIFVGTSDENGQERMLVQHGNPHMDDPAAIAPDCVEAGWGRLVTPGQDF